VQSPLIIETDEEVFSEDASSKTLLVEKLTVPVY
jgi:hypothetical protein